MSESNLNEELGYTERDVALLRKLNGGYEPIAADQVAESAACHEGSESNGRQLSRWCASRNNSDIPTTPPPDCLIAGDRSGANTCGDSPAPADRGRHLITATAWQTSKQQSSVSPPSPRTIPGPHNNPAECAATTPSAASTDTGTSRGHEEEVVVCTIPATINEDKTTNVAEPGASSLLIRRYTDYQSAAFTFPTRKRVSIGSLSIVPNENPAVNDRRLSRVVTSIPERAGIIRRMSMLVAESKDGVVTLNELPISFQVKYLGQNPARGLWGIKHTRGPVDAMVKSAKNLPAGTVLPFIKVTISTKGIILTHSTSKGTRNDTFYAIETISYGVQDLVYTRVFSMIVVHEDAKDFKNQHPFECHAFVCESRNAARRLTYALAAAFQEYSKKVQEQAKEDPCSPIKKKFAIDLRSPEEIQDDIDAETEA